MNTANTPPFDRLLHKTLQCSRYARQVLEAEPALQEWLSTHHASPCSREEMLALLQGCSLDLNNEAELARALRMLRKRVMIKLILRDLNGLAGLDEVTQAMTVLAEVCVRLAQPCMMHALHEQYGSPVGETTQTPQELLVIGMGKLGGAELNVSSDIDLILVYPEDGETDGTRKLSNHEFFTRLGRKLISLINDLTADGYVFRVDMRLRPYGDSGPLVMSFDALEEYLVSQGREWERYAWIKARVISPAEHPAISTLYKLAQPFVFRKYLDFGAIDSMRKLHAQIRQEVQRRERKNNVKLGPGGIREIEFIAQVFQLIRGGRDAKLRIRPTQKVLRLLTENGQLDAGIAAQLDEAYVFLRNLEHRLQYLDDQQTQEMPEKPEEQTIIAGAMGYADYTTLMAEFNRHRALVSQQFESIFREQGAAEATLPWRDGVTLEELSTHLSSLGYRNAPEGAQRLLQLREGGRYRQLPDTSRQRIDRLTPQFVEQAARQADPDAALLRSLSLLETISRRASYLAFLTEYPQALQRLVHLLGASNWAAEYLMQHPALFDELLDPREIYQPPDWHEFDHDLTQRLADCEGDFERQLDVLRQTQQEQTFHLLAMDLQGLLPLEKLSDHLSDLADLMLRHVLELAWSTSNRRHCEQPKFAIIAYGKLGGRELGYASDLDLIFLYDDAHPDAQENYARLAKRINTVLGSYTASGRLYETDLRLRPNGESGLLVSTVEAFADYQHTQAWVWEHQALTRARFCTGDVAVGATFERIRNEVLCKERDQAKLREEILSMRQKMHDGHPNPSGLFDIKHDSGGMVDIEFMVQYLVLAHAHAHPELAGNIGNIALLKLSGDLGLVESALAQKVLELYRKLRRIQHRLRLNSAAPCRIPQDEIDSTACLELWKLLFRADL